MGMGARMILGWLVPVLLAAAPPRRPPVLPPLMPGESLVLAGPDREVYHFGDTASESPMGGLAHLLWVRLEGDAWASGGLEFKCTGKAGPFLCAGGKAHGRVDLPSALQAGCNLAFMGWARMSAERWMDTYGEGAARARMVDVFGPFLGKRMPDGEGLPPLSMAWFGEGDLLRTSPADLLKWLQDPGQEEVVRLYRRLMLSFYDESFKDNAWWVDAATTPAVGDPNATQAWAVGGNSLVLAVLRLPPGSTRAQALARFRTVMVGDPKKKK